ncbi:DNA-binding protein [Sphingobacterium psychroaquaticum]|uniref:helix-turn-helix domain-containing protein n=1 Tax=Sphingobacterium psychroaquaticum TaxID=561061 RepID=UPI00106B6924|nr:helix-turn-helix domain-containing protein [Sphingobacterium psychroaquaticum]QBQ41292.1 DNA-binding protein [Sphingobacterium psychroaquaticum]
MAIEIITQEDLRNFKRELLTELKQIMQSENNTPQKKWIRTREVIKMLQISQGTLQNLRINGTIPYTRIGTTIYYPLQEIENILKQGSKNQAP